MTDLTYDPELPFVAVGVSTREVFARFSNLEGAVSFSDDGPYAVEVIDTTPKPKIPEDAEYIIWRGDRNSILEFAEKTQGYWAWSGLEISEIGLIECVGDAEVTVLVRKEES